MVQVIQFQLRGTFFPSLLFLSSLLILRFFSGEISTPLPLSPDGTTPRAVFSFLNQYD